MPRVIGYDPQVRFELRWCEYRQTGLALENEWTPPDAPLPFAAPAIRSVPTPDRSCQ
jgi:hypothetical protein